MDKESLQEDLQRCKVLVDSLHKEMVQKESDNLQDVKVVRVTGVGCCGKADDL